MSKANITPPGTVSFDLHQSRLMFINIGLRLIWAGIKGDKVIWFKDIEYEQVIDNTNGAEDE